MAAFLLRFAILLAAGHAGCRGASVGEESAVQLLCAGGATAVSPDSRTAGAAGCIELHLPPAPEARLAGDYAALCSHDVVDFLCAAENGDPCVRLTADGRSVAKRSFTDSACLRHACAEVCAAPGAQDSAQVTMFCERCRGAKLFDAADMEAARFFGGGGFWSLLSGCLTLLCKIKPFFCNHNVPFQTSPPPPPAQPLVPSPPPAKSPPPLPPGTSPSPPPPASVKCGASSPASCLGVPCAGVSSCTTSSPQCCCAADCVTFGDCCADRQQCCLTREAAPEERAHSASSARGSTCGSPPPGQSCQNIACSGAKTCNLAQRTGAAVLQTSAPSGCCCDELCRLMDDCCEDKDDCCGTATSEPRRGQLVIGRTETAAFSTERVTPRGINVARGVNTRTGVGLLVPQQDGVLRDVGDGPGGTTRAAWAPAPAESPSAGDVPEE